MKYMGSKNRVAGQIVPIIQRAIERDGRRAYLEPFTGGANIIDKIRCPLRIGADNNPDLIALLQYVQAGGVLPLEISREEYHRVKEKRLHYPRWYVGAVGFLASYNARFFGGYAGRVQTQAGTVRDYYQEARRNLEAQAPALKGIIFQCRDYREITPEGFAVYCDPPYMTETGYAADDFNSLEFWDTMRRWSGANTVIISEQTAPPDFACIWQNTVIRTQDHADRQKAFERLFVYAPDGHAPGGPLDGTG